MMDELETRGSEHLEAQKAGGWKQDVQKALNALVNVRVVTAIATIELEATESKGRLDLTIKSLKDTTPIFTEVNLLTGDIENLMAASVKDDADLRAFHAQQVEVAMRVLPDNVKMFVDLARRVIDDIT